MIEEGAQVEVDEFTVLNKYEGDVSDLSDEELAGIQPLETLKIHNGQIIEHIVWKEDNN